MPVYRICFHLNNILFVTLVVYCVKNVLCHIKLRIAWETVLQVPEPAIVHDAEEESPEEVSDDGGDEEDHHVHDSELDQLLTKHGLPAQLPQLQLLLQVLDVVVSCRLAILFVARNLILGNIFLFPDLATYFLLTSFLLLRNETIISNDASILQLFLTNLGDVDKYVLNSLILKHFIGEELEGEAVHAVQDVLLSGADVQRF